MIRKLWCRLFGHKKPLYRALALGKWPCMACRRCRLSIYLCDDWHKGGL